MSGIVEFLPLLSIYCPAFIPNDQKLGTLFFGSGSNWGWIGRPVPTSMGTGWFKDNYFSKFIGVKKMLVYSLYICYYILEKYHKSRLIRLKSDKISRSLVLRSDSRLSTVFALLFKTQGFMDTKRRGIM